MKVVQTCFFMSCFLSFCFSSFVPVTVSVGLVSIAGYFVREPLYCIFKECCKDKWIPDNISRLNMHLNTQVFGQHIAVEVVYKAVKGHVENPNPSKALVLSFHGWTGCGKNHMSNIIADSLYTLGGSSNYVHKIITTTDFPHAEKLSHYKDILISKIVRSVKDCPKTMFIFDEVDKVPKGLLNVVKPFLDHHETVNDVDYRQCIFIFLSNTGARVINNFVISQWQKGKKREDLTMKDLEMILNNEVYNVDNGLWHSELISHNLIDFFVPFLPLERHHIKECIKVDLLRKDKNPTVAVVNKIADQMQYEKPDMVFSSTGCKRVSTRVDYVINEG